MIKPSDLLPQSQLPQDPSRQSTPSGLGHTTEDSELGSVRARFRTAFQNLQQARLQSEAWLIERSRSAEPNNLQADSGALEKLYREWEFERSMYEARTAFWLEIGTQDPEDSHVLNSETHLSTPSEKHLTKE